MNLSFYSFYKLKEMATANFGKNKGKHINDIDRGYAWWLKEKLDSGRSTFFDFQADDGSGRLSNDQLKKALQIRLSGGFVAPTSVNSPIISKNELKQKNITPTQTQQPLKNNGSKNNGLIPEEQISDYQKSIDKSFSESNKHLVVNALAGTGKTTILKHLASKYCSGNGSWLYLVFNKSNQKEAESSFPSCVKPLTSHSFLYSVIKNTIKENPKSLQGYEKSVKFDQYKVSKILDKDEEGEWFFEIVNKLDNALPDEEQKRYLIRYHNKKQKYIVSYGVKKNISKLVGLCKNNAVDPRSADAKEKIDEIFRKYEDGKSLTPYVFSGNSPGPDFKNQFIELTIEVLKVTSPGGSIGDHEIDRSKDFDDMLWHPSLHQEKMAWPSNFKVVLVDEVQDFNEAQKIMLSNLAKKGSRIIAVGDPRQAIYSFRGADAKGFSNVESMLGKTETGSITHDLPVNYRSGKKIIDHVNRTTKVKNLQAGRDHDGEVNDMAQEKDLVDDIKQEWKKNGSFQHSTAFISRNNAPLFGIAVNLLSSGVPFQILGSDLSSEILDFIYKVLGDGNAAIGRSKAQYTSTRDFLEMSNKFISREHEKYDNKKQKESYLKEIEKLDEALMGFIDSYKDNELKNVSDMCSTISQIFKGLEPSDKEQDAEKYKNIDKKKNIILTTAHRSKGFEWEKVNIISNELFPGDTDDSDNPDDQEHNAKYVAYTRATHKLNISETPKAE